MLLILGIGLAAMLAGCGKGKSVQEAPVDTTIGTASSSIPSGEATAASDAAEAAASAATSQQVAAAPDPAPQASETTPAPVPPPDVAPTARSNDPPPDQGSPQEAVATSLDVGRIDCGRPSSSVSIVICANTNLRGRDGHIAAIYRTLVGNADADQKAQYAQEQRTWIASRNACGSVTCLTVSYDQRLRTITSEAWAQYNSQRTANPAQ
jgi:uncharacterized protein YecT (DUF1311 family)